MAIWPVYVVGDAMGALEFSVTCEDAELVDSAFSLQDEGEPFGELKRSYAATEVQRRIHQGAFRERVLLAYQRRCAFCSLRHEELLDAAHIIPDSELHGEPVVSNGMSLCRLHHAAFDRLILGVRPDYIIRVRADVLEEADGPMLRHGLQGGCKGSGFWCQAGGWIGRMRGGWGLGGKNLAKREDTFNCGVGESGELSEVRVRIQVSRIHSEKPDWFRFFLWKTNRDSIPSRTCDKIDLIGNILIRHGRGMVSSQSASNRKSNPR